MKFLEKKTLRGVEDILRHMNFPGGKSDKKLRYMSTIPRKGLTVVLSLLSDVKDSIVCIKVADFLI